MKLQTLHSHTTNSDGQFNHKELLEKAKKYNINTIALTDHDGIISQKQIDSIKDIDDIRWISGIEISSGWPLDLGGGAASGLHIVGLFVDYDNTELKEHCRKAQDARIERMKKMIKNLTGIGFKITEKDCLEESKGEAVGRPHIVKALLRYEENIQRMEEIKEDMRKVTETDPSLLEQYNILSERPEQYPYVLFLSESSFIRNIYVEYSYYLDMDKSVQIIRNAGGVAILAHYFTCSSKMDEHYLESIIKEKRIDGVETVFGLHAFGTSEEGKIKDSIATVQKVADKYDCIKSGGADAHTEDDLKIFYENKEYNQRTINILEDMIDGRKLNIQFSNIER